MPDADKPPIAGKPRLPRKRLLIVATLVFILIGAAYAVWWALFAEHFESTDDAYVHGDLVQVTSQISGTVIAIDADDTQQVTQGAALVRLDPADTAIALKQAQAALAQAVRQTQTLFVQNDALNADIAMREADLDRSKVDLNKAESDLKRRQTLSRSGGVSGEEILHAQTATKAAQSGVAQANAALEAARARLKTNQALTSNTNVAQHPDVLKAADQLRQAWLAHSRTQVPAPVTGMVAQRSAQVGQHVAAGATLMSIVPLQQLWVEANFKENQLRHMAPGQTATLTADMYGTKITYTGRIEGIAAGTGGAFALLPAQNASGNWIKVVQRVPVRIALNPEELAKHPLRVGLSMQVKVNLGGVDAHSPMASHNGRLQTSVFTDASQDAEAMIDRTIKENTSS
jgi:membrane fusion protein (multidrug efflux system)